MQDTLRAAYAALDNATDHEYRRLLRETIDRLEAEQLTAVVFQPAPEKE